MKTKKITQQSTADLIKIKDEINFELQRRGFERPLTKKEQAIMRIESITSILRTFRNNKDVLNLKIITQELNKNLETLAKKIL